jgi:hypothetical protein
MTNANNCQHSVLNRSPSGNVWECAEVDCQFSIRSSSETAQQLHAALKTAQELAATRLMEVERLTRDMAALQSQWDDMQQGFVEVFGEPVRDAIELLGATERLKSAHEPCEQLEPKYECHVCGRKYRTTEVRDHHQEECKDIAESWRTFKEGASRDASPADLVGALQDVVHTDTGAVRAGRSVKSGVFAEILSHHPDCSFHSTVAPAPPVCDCGAGLPPPCECLVRDKEPSAYHNVNCPRYISNLL